MCGAQFAQILSYLSVSNDSACFADLENFPIPIQMKREKNIRQIMRVTLEPAPSLRESPPR
jgi:hypothetical protein